MSEVLKLSSPIPPSVNHYLAHRVIMQNGKPTAMVYETKEAKDYKREFIAYIKSEVKKQCWNLKLDKFQHFYIDEVFYFDRIDKDCNNYQKLLLDSITESEMIWYDDNVVCERINRIYYDSKDPRIEIEIRPVEYIGIFDNKDELNSFEDKCKKCKRYSRNCSLLQNAKTGRVQDEIKRESDNLVCEKEKPSK